MVSIWSRGGSGSLASHAASICRPWPVIAYTVLARRPVAVCSRLAVARLSRTSRLGSSYQTLSAVGQHQSRLRRSCWVSS